MQPKNNYQHIPNKEIVACSTFRHQFVIFCKNSTQLTTFWLFQSIIKIWSLRSPPWSATLPWWWGLAPMTRKISKIWKRGATKRWPNSCRQIATCYQCSCAGFSFTADYGFIAKYSRLYSRLLTASQLLTALWPLPVTFWLHSGTRIGPNSYGLSAGQV